MSNLYTQAEQDELRALGGVKIARGMGEHWNFGLVQSHDPEWTVGAAQALAEQSVREQPFRIDGKVPEGDKAYLWELWKDPRARMKDGGVFPGIRQVTGSCVGAAGFNIMFGTQATEVVRLGDAELIALPCWLLTYGRSRYHTGMRGRGEGSTEPGWEKAILTDGICRLDEEGIPQPNKTGAGVFTWPSSVEYEWSDGSRIPERYLALARQHLIKTSTRILDGDQGRDALKAGYYLGWTGDWGGRMKCPIRGTPPRLMNDHASSWSHRESCVGWENHPEFGDIYYILNQWDGNTHGICPSGAPPGGYWITRKDFEWQCRNGSVRAYSQFNGFPAPDWEIPWIIRA